MIMENPWNEINYTNHFWFMKPTIIDHDRSRRGDYFVKPTAYWFLNCTPTYGTTYQQTPKTKRKNCDIGNWVGRPNKHKKEDRAKGSKKVGICSEERSMISPDYARNFICDFILGREQLDINRQLKLF